MGRENLRQLLLSGIIHELPVTQLRALKEIPTVNILAAADFWLCPKVISGEDALIGIEIIVALSDVQCDRTPALLVHFLQDLLPHFVARFAHSYAKDVIYADTGRLLAWFEVYQAHALRLNEAAVEELEAAAIAERYYKMPFATVIKYVPDYIWWQRGMEFLHLGNLFPLGGTAFQYLAVGESVRKLPDLPFHFTRRMAREFVQLPLDLDAHFQRDLHLYIYVKSLGATPKLLWLSFDYIRHSVDQEVFDAVLAAWTPMLQKLSSEVFEAMETEEQQALLGYVAHILQDRPTVNLTTMSHWRLVTEASNAYFRRIQARAHARAQEKARLEEARRKDNAGRYSVT